MFTISFDQAGVHLAKQVRTLSAMKLFHVLPTHLSYHEFRDLDQCTVAAELGTTQASISRGMAELADLGVVEKRRHSRNIEWRLSPDYGWKGDVESYDKADDRRKVFPRAPAGGSSIVAEGISSPANDNG